MEYEIITKRPVDYAVDEIGGGFKSAIIKMKVADVYFDPLKKSVSVSVLVANPQGVLLKRVPIPYKQESFLGLFGPMNLNNFLANLEQALITTIDAMNTQISASGSDKLVFYGLFASDMQLVEIPEPSVPGA